MTTLTIIRGLPGSGKSTLAKKMLNEAMFAWEGNRYRDLNWFEADHFFQSSYKYQFDPKLLPQAHNWCFVNTIKSLRDGCDTIVSNTFTQLWEMSRYLKIEEFVKDVEIRVIEVKTQFENIHNVPAEKIEQMQQRWEEIPSELGLSVEVISD